MEEQIAAAARNIESNPLGRLMHGQRELFHSNLLAWFFDALPEAADRVFGPMSGAGESVVRVVERERAHLDLVMRMPGRAPLVIENKVFSLPDRSQLERYASAQRWGSAPNLVLLSASMPDFDPAPWRHVDYRDLADAIDASLPATTDYEVETMRRYAQLARDVQALVDAVAVRSHEESVWIPDAALAAVGSPQTRAALQKARAMHVARRIRSLELPASWYVKADMTRGVPLVEAFRPVVDDGHAVRLGWQLQGMQLRRAVIFDDADARGRGDAKRERRIEIARAHPHWFAFPPPLPADRGGRGEFGHYAPDFIYQYVKTPGLTVGSLLDAIDAVRRGVEDSA